MMQIYTHFIRAVIIMRYYFHRLTRTGGFGPGRAAPFHPGPGETRGRRLRAGLFRHHVKQFHESSCSVASVVSVVNTLGERAYGRSKWRPVTQEGILDRVRAAHWKERMGPGGFQGRRGLPLDLLGRVVEAALDAYGLPYGRVEVINTGDRNGPERIKAGLTAFQTRDHCLVIAHFDQGAYTRELNIPHISPVGGYDPDTGRVTILDVDPLQPLPYTLPFSTFYRGISTSYGGIFRGLGYGRGGVVVIWRHPGDRQ